MSFNPKELIIAVVLVLFSLFSSFFFWFNWNKILADPLSLIWGNLELPGLVLQALAGLLPYLALISLACVLLSKLWLRLTVLLFSTPLLLIVFYQSEPVFLLLTFMPLVFGLAVFAWQSEKEIQSHIKMRLNHIFTPTLSTLMLFLIIVMSIQTFSAAKKLGTDFKIQIPEWIFKQVLGQIGNLGGGNLPFGGNVQGVLQVKGATSEIDLQAILEGKIPLPLEVRSYFEKGQLPPEIMQELQKQGVSAEMVSSLLDGLTVDSQGYLKSKTAVGQLFDPGNQNLTDIFAKQLKDEVENQINSMISPFKKYLPFILSALVFLILFSVKGILVSLVVTLFGLTVLILRLIKVVRLEKKEVEAERLVI
ncbi:MAG: hypothetical protein UT37_C0009G0010 [Parcubacteria group bacterium GW2011_GWA2_39_18]|nr:MAG: hypothetical protein UT37_C0009G0010 [Parcubacteria group bacterium GW2011_GWA2_39_18]